MYSTIVMPSPWARASASAATLTARGLTLRSSPRQHRIPNLRISLAPGRAQDPPGAPESPRKPDLRPLCSSRRLSSRTDTESMRVCGPNHPHEVTTIHACRIQTLRR